MTNSEGDKFRCLTHESVKLHSEIKYAFKRPNASSVKEMNCVNYHEVFKSDMRTHMPELIEHEEK